MSHRKVPESLRKIVVKRAREQCEYCRTIIQASPQRFQMEYIQPYSKGGKEELKNLALTCGGCNNSKYNKTHSIDPLSGKKVRLFNPRKDNWDEHFAWDEEPLFVIGISPIGRATTKALRLNRPELIAVRTLLSELNRHPPN